MRIQAIHALGERGLLLWRITDDPLTLSAAKCLLQAVDPKLTPPQIRAKELIEKQLDAYTVLYTNPLV